MRPKQCDPFRNAPRSDRRPHAQRKAERLEHAPRVGAVVPLANRHGGKGYDEECEASKHGHDSHPPTATFGPHCCCTARLPHGVCDRPEERCGGDWQREASRQLGCGHRRRDSAVVPVSVLRGAAAGRRCAPCRRCRWRAMRLRERCRRQRCRWEGPWHIAAAAPVPMRPHGRCRWRASSGRSVHWHGSNRRTRCWRRRALFVLLSVLLLLLPVLRRVLRRVLWRVRLLLLPILSLVVLTTLILCLGDIRNQQGPSRACCLGSIFDPGVCGSLC